MDIFPLVLIVSIGFKRKNISAYLQMELKFQSLNMMSQKICHYITTHSRVINTIVKKKCPIHGTNYGMALSVRLSVRP